MQYKMPKKLPIINYQVCTVVVVVVVNPQYGFSDPSRADNKIENNNQM